MLARHPRLWTAKAADQDRSTRTPGEIIKRMKTVFKIPTLRIASYLGRNKTTVYSALKTQKAVKKGRPPVLLPKEIKRIISTLKAMVKAAKARREVTMAMLLKRTKTKVGARCVHRALVKHGVKFRRLRSKPILTSQDKKERYKFAKKYKNKPASFWLNRVHLHIDCKNFPVYADASARDYAAMRSVRGVYRTLGQGLDEAYVVAPKHMKYNTNVKSCRILGGVAKAGVILWHDYGPKWNGRVAADTYNGPMVTSLRQAWPRTRSFTVLEDNDPTGFKSNRGTTL